MRVALRALPVPAKATVSGTSKAIPAAVSVSEKVLCGKGFMRRPLVSLRQRGALVTFVSSVLPGKRYKLPEIKF